MKYFLLIGILIFIYYKFNKKYPDYLDKKYHFYFGGGVGVFLLLYYLSLYEKPFINDVLHNIKTVDNKPLYDLSVIKKEDDKMLLLKTKMAQNQAWRCLSCKNIIVEKDLNEYSINYKIPLRNGGKHHVNNMGLYCPVCNKFNTN